MKKPGRKARATQPKQPRPIDESALAAAGGGADNAPAAPWTPDQHSETLSAFALGADALPAERAVARRLTRCQEAMTAGRFARAEAHARAAAKRASALPATSTVRWIAEGALGTALRIRARYAAAAVHLRSSVQLARPVGPLALASAKNALGMLYKYTGNWAAGMRLYREALAIYEAAVRPARLRGSLRCCTTSAGPSMRAGGSRVARCMHGAGWRSGARRSGGTMCWSHAMRRRSGRCSRGRASWRRRGGCTGGRCACSRRGASSSRSR